MRTIVGNIELLENERLAQGAALIEVPCDPAGVAPMAAFTHGCGLLINLPTSPQRGTSSPLD